MYKDSTVLRMFWIFLTDKIDVKSIFLFISNLFFFFFGIGGNLSKCYKITITPLDNNLESFHPLVAFTEHTTLSIYTYVCVPLLQCPVVKYVAIYTGDWSHWRLGTKCTLPRQPIWDQKSICQIRGGWSAVEWCKIQSTHSLCRQFYANSLTLPNTYISHLYQQIFLTTKSKSSIKVLKTNFNSGKKKKLTLNFFIFFYKLIILNTFD